MRSRYTWLGLAMLLVAAPAQAQVLITEVQPNPAGSGTDSGEWVEIHNTGTGVVSIEGWILNDFGPTPPREYSFPTGASLSPGQVIIVARLATQYETTAAAEGFAVLVPDYELADTTDPLLDDAAVPNLTITLAGGGGFALGNSGDGVQLRNSAGVVQSTAEYGSGRSEVPGNPSALPGDGESISRVANTGSSDVDFVVLAVPNPGTGYGGAIAQPPVISNPIRAPAALTHGGTFDLSADVADADGIAGVEFYFAAATSSIGPASGSYVAVAAAAAGNTHSVSGSVATPAPGITIPAPTGFNQRYIRYWVYALDNSADDAFSPANADTTASNPNYYWENVLPATGLTPIATARAQDSRELPNWDGHSVRIQGVATTTQEAFITGTTNFFIADPTGVEAIRIFDNGVSVTVNPGDVVTVTGKIGAFRGVRQVGRDERAGQPAVVGDEIQVQVSGTAPVPMQTVTIAQLLASGEQYESSLVRIDNVSLPADPGTWGANTNVDVTDGTGTLVVRVVSVTDLAGASTPGGTFAVQGIFTQFAPTGRGGYQLQPRGIADIIGGTPQPDGGVVDTGVTDAGVTDTGGPTADTGVADTGGPAPDTGLPPDDSGVGPGEDSGVNPGTDSGVNPGDDAGVRPDSGTFGGGGGSGSRDKGGCTCLTDDDGEAPWSGLALGLLLLGVVRRRRS